MVYHKNSKLYHNVLYIGPIATSVSYGLVWYQYTRQYTNPYHSVSMNKIVKIVKDEPYEL